MINFIQRLFRMLYRTQISKRIGHVGNGFYVRKPFYLIGGNHITIGSNFSATEGVRVEAWDTFGNDHFKPEIIIGNNVSVNYNTHIGAINRIVIGDNVLMGSNVLILDHDHGMTNSFNELNTAPARRKLYSKGPVVIGNNVWIADKVTILAGVTIGDGAVIGANSVVTKDIPAYSVVVGNAAKVLKTLDSKLEE